VSNDLNEIAGEIEQYLGENNFIAFHTAAHLGDTPTVQWDTERHPEFRQFLKAAKQLEVRLICLSLRTLRAPMLDSTLDDLEEAEFPEDLEHEMRRRLEQLRGYEGFTAAVELSFDHDGRQYFYSVRAPWYTEFLSIANTIDTRMEQFDEKDDEGPTGPYYSQN